MKNIMNILSAFIAKIASLFSKQTATEEIKKVMEQPLVRELFQTDDDLGYC